MNVQKIHGIECVGDLDPYVSGVTVTVEDAEYMEHDIWVENNNFWVDWEEVISQITLEFSPDVIVSVTSDYEM